MLAGHRVLITGGGSGVGADMALAFAAAGAEVVVAGRRREALDAVVAGEPRMRAIKADVTANSDDDKALLKRFNLFGPPGTIFYDAKGQQIDGVRVIGFQNAERFAQTLKAAGL